MTTFKDIMAADLAAVFNSDEFAFAAMHRCGHVETPVIVLLDLEDGGHDDYATFGWVQVPKTSLSTPAYGDIFLIDGTEFIVFEDARRHLHIRDEKEDLVWLLPVGASKVFSTGGYV